MNIWIGSSKTTVDLNTNVQKKNKINNINYSKTEYVSVKTVAHGNENYTFRFFESGIVYMKNYVSLTKDYEKHITRVYLFTVNLETDDRKWKDKHFLQWNFDFLRNFDDDVQLHFLEIDVWEEFKELVINVAYYGERY